MKHLYGINRGPNETPQEAFDRLCESKNSTPLVFNIIATMGWTNIISQIILLKDKLPYPFSGITLSTKIFPLNYQLP